MLGSVSESTAGGRVVGFWRGMAYARAVRVRTLLVLGCAVLTACSSGDTPGGVAEGNTAAGGNTPPAPSRETLGFFAPNAAVAWLPGAAEGGGEARFMTTRSARAGAGPLAVAGDFDGDGLDSVSTYDLVGNVFHLRNTNDETPDAASIVVGAVGEFPLAGDFDGDGIDTLGTFSLTDGRFGLLRANVADAEADEVHIDALGLPVAADLDGIGRDAPGVYDVQARAFRFRGVGADAEVVVPFDIGVIEVYPLAGDLDDDGIDDLGLADSATSSVHIRYSATGAVEVFGSSRAFEWQSIIGRWAPAASTLERDGFAWKEASPSSVGIDGAVLADGLAWAEGRPYLHGVLVARHGSLVAEQYFNDFRASDPQCIKSVSKSVLSALFGIAYARGEVTPETRIVDVLPEYFGGLEPEKQAIQVGHLLTMSAGLAWEENSSEYFEPFILAEDPAAFVLSLPLVAEPGTVFLYNTGLTHLAARVLERATKTPVSQYAAQHLFAPLGIEAQRWDHDIQNHDVGGWEVWMPPRDLARFGQLYLDGGSIDGQQIVPSAWVEGTTQAFIADYGGWWWIRETAGHPTFYAWGWGGQFIFVIDELDLVVVVTSEWWDQASLDAAYDQAFSLLDDWVAPAVASGG